LYGRGESEDLNQAIQLTVALVEQMPGKTVTLGDCIKAEVGLHCPTGVAYRGDDLGEW